MQIEWERLPEEDWRDLNRNDFDLFGCLIMKKRMGVSPLNESKIEKVKDSNASPPKKAYLDVKVKKDVVKRIPVEDRIATLTESIRYNLFDFQLYYQRGILYFNEGKTTEALNDCNRAIKINPQFGKAYYARAELWAALNNNRLAMMNLEKAMELEGLKREYDLNPVIIEEKEATIIDGDIGEREGKPVLRTSQ